MRILLFCLFAASLAAQQEVMVPMRDGVKLSTYLYFPEGKGPWPVLYEQRYSFLRGNSSMRNYRNLAAKGFVVAAQNFRGTYRSEGAYDGYRNLGWLDHRDGYDSVEWLAKQSWSTGKIGTFGGSQAGYAQNFLAVTQPPHLVAQYMTDTGLSLFHLGYRRGGTTRPKRFLSMLETCRNPADGLRWLEDTLKHPTYDDYWRDEDCTLHFDKMNVPAFTLGSWFDFMSVGSIESFIGREHKGGPNSRGKQKLLLGPWLHGGTKGPKIGDMVFAANATFDVWDHMGKWFDHYLKGIDNGVEKDAPVRYYVMGADEWRTAKDWPIPASTVSYYFGEGQVLGPGKSTGSTAFRADPDNPAPIAGRSFPGAQDGRAYERHADVRTFTTEALASSVEWTGLVKAELHFSSDAPDTDVLVRVSDVHPDGRSILILDGIQRLRFREGFEKEILMKPGEVYKVAFDIGWLSQVFLPGHRIRVAVSSGGADLYEPNPNTGLPFSLGAGQKVFIATNTLHHSEAHASRILAPVVVSKQ